MKLQNKYKVPLENTPSMAVKKALRGHTCRTLTDNADGEEMVQTATTNRLASES